MSTFTGRTVCSRQYVIRIDGFDSADGIGSNLHGIRTSRRTQRSSCSSGISPRKALGRLYPAVFLKALINLYNRTDYTSYIFETLGKLISLYCEVIDRHEARPYLVQHMANLAKCRQITGLQMAELLSRYDRKLESRQTKSVAVAKGKSKIAGFGRSRGAKEQK